MQEARSGDAASRMHVAFVNQAIDRVLPPLQNSVRGLHLRAGPCTDPDE